MKKLRKTIGHLMWVVPGSWFAHEVVKDLGPSLVYVGAFLACLVVMIVYIVIMAILIEG